MPVLLLFAFLSGLVTIFAPCVWPLLPVALTSSSLQGRLRPLGVTLGILISFGTLTLSIAYLVHLVGFDVSLVRTIAVVVLVAIAVMVLLPALGDRVDAVISRSVGGAGWSLQGHGFWSGLVSGLPLGVVWAPCAGPILATIATLAATREVGASIVLVTVFYLAGIGLPLLLLSYASQHLLQASRVFTRYTGAIQRGAAVVMLVTAGLIYFDLDTSLEAELLASVPAYTGFINRLEGNDRVTAQLDKLRGSQPYESRLTTASNDAWFNKDEPASELTGITRWLNLAPGQEPLSLEQLRGKVVLIDFWTYTCINCIRTLDHVNAWYERYRDDGFVVIGVHSPEFAFERDTGNVQQAIQRFGIKYPVAQDNDYATWKAFRNQYWPAEYLIDRQGQLRRVKFGEGKYAQTEQAIRELLKQPGAPIAGALTATPDRTPRTLSSPESYLGGDDMSSYNLVDKVGSIGAGQHIGLVLSTELRQNTFSFGGDWNVQPESAVSVRDSVLEYRFHARYVYLVMHRPAQGEGSAMVFVDGKSVNARLAGADVIDGAVTVDSDRLYELVRLENAEEFHILRLEFSPGVQLYAFTFG